MSPAARAALGASAFLFRGINIYRFICRLPCTLGCLPPGKNRAGFPTPPARSPPGRAPRGPGEAVLCSRGRWRRRLGVTRLGPARRSGETCEQGPSRGWRRSPCRGSETWTNTGSVGTRPGPRRLSDSLGLDILGQPRPDAGLDWAGTPGPHVWPYTGSWLQGQDLGSRGVACIGGTVIHVYQPGLLWAGTGEGVPAWPFSGAEVGVFRVRMAKPLLGVDWGAEPSPLVASDLCGDTDTSSPVGGHVKSPDIETLPGVAWARGSVVATALPLLCHGDTQEEGLC